MVHIDWEVVNVTAAIMNSTILVAAVITEFRRWLSQRRQLRQIIATMRQARTILAEPDVTTGQGANNDPKAAETNRASGPGNQGRLTPSTSE